MARCSRCGADERSTIHHVESGNAEIKNAAHRAVCSDGARPTCGVCGKPATCLGCYEGQAGGTYACDDCCGHGNEDGKCAPIALLAQRGWPTMPETEREHKLGIALLGVAQERDSIGHALISTQQMWSETKAHLDALTTLLRAAVASWQEQSDQLGVKARSVVESEWYSSSQVTLDRCIREIEEALADSPFSTETPQSAGAVDPHAADTGKPSTREAKS
jgi:hypothetical protein